MKNIETLTVYLGSSGHADPVFQDSAVKLGQLIAQEQKHLVYGGMDAGLMGLLAQHCLQSGGQVTGIIPQKLKDSERILDNLSETILVQELWERKKRMFEMADAVVSLPGGFGTLDESLEVLYWGHLKRHNKPLILVNIESYWDDLITFIRACPDFDARYLVVVERPEDVFAALDNCVIPGLNGDLSPQQTDPRAVAGMTDVKEAHYPHFEDSIRRDTDEPIIIDKASVENAYYLICALGLKQLGKHHRHIGILNPDGVFDPLLNWFKRAAKETFITQKCLDLYDSDVDRDTLITKLDTQKDIEIDLHGEKWGERK